MSNKEGRDVVWRDIGVYFFSRFLPPFVVGLFLGLAPRKARLTFAFLPSMMGLASFVAVSASLWSDMVTCATKDRGTKQDEDAALIFIYIHHLIRGMKIMNIGRQMNNTKWRYFFAIHHETYHSFDLKYVMYSGRTKPSGNVALPYIIETAFITWYEVGG